MMKIQINTGHNIEGQESLVLHFTNVVTEALSRFSDQITRVEVHLSDTNGDKGGADKRCVMEVRLEGRQPTAVTNEASTLDEAVTGATEKLKRSISSTLGRLHDQR